MTLYPWAPSSAAAAAITSAVQSGETRVAQRHDRDNQDRMDRRKRPERMDRRRGDHREVERRQEYRSWHRDRVVVVPRARRRVYRNVVIVRPYGHFYRGYGHYIHDDDAFRWLAFTAITLKILDLVSEDQQRAYEDAQIRATQAPVGEAIYWNRGGASGSVVTTREGTSSSGRYCREFQQTVTIGGRTEQAYGTACRQADGSWEVVSTR